MGALLATLVLAIEIHAAGDCPGAAEVERQLRPLLGEAAAAGTSDVATIKQAARRFRLGLARRHESGAPSAVGGCRPPDLAAIRRRPWP